MKTMLILLPIGVFSLPATMWAAADVTTCNGKGVNAFFSSADSSGCIGTDVFVTASDAAGLSFSSGSKMTVLIYQYDSCNGGTPLLDVGAFDVPLASRDFDVAGNLASATLNTTAWLYDFVSGEYLEFVISLAWTRTGPLEGGTNTGYLMRIGQCHSVSHYRGSVGTATASGSAEHGAANYTPASALFSDINSSLFGEVWSNCQ